MRRTTTAERKRAVPEPVDPPEALHDRLDALFATSPDLLPCDARVLVGVSGGPDSTALASVLHTLAPRYGWNLELAHFDHGLRPESARDADRVRALAGTLGLACHATRGRGLSGGQAAYRDARYAWFESLLRSRNAVRVALAHHADDQHETVLLRLARGTGWSGLAGIPPRRGPFVRPLLSESRRTLRNYAYAAGLPFVDDPSNVDPRYDRARVRAAWLPALEGFGDAAERSGAIGGNAARVTLHRQHEVRSMARQVRVGPRGPRGGVQIARSGLRAYDPADRRAILRLLAARFGVCLTRGATFSADAFAMDGRSGAAIEVGGGLELSRSFDRLRLGRPIPRPENLEVEIADRVGGEALARIGGRRLRVRWRGDGRVGRGMVSLSVTADAFPLRLRAPRPGDRIRLSGGTRKLQDVFVDRRIPVACRCETPVLEDAAGTIRWVAGVAVAAGTRPGGAAGGRFTIEIDDLGCDRG